jgi:hypothetical protein
MVVAAIRRGDEETHPAGIGESAGHCDLPWSRSLGSESRRQGARDQNGAHGEDDIETNETYLAQEYSSRSVSLLEI